jgi:hypothetical protein
MYDMHAFVMFFIYVGVNFPIFSTWKNMILTQAKYFCERMALIHGLSKKNNN